MKVLHISAGALYGGVERVLCTLAEYRALSPSVNPHFAVCFEGRLSQELRSLNVPVHVLGETRASNPLTVVRARKALRGLLKREKFDVAVCHLPWAHAIFAPVVRSAAVPVVFWMHGFASGTHWRDLHWSERWARRTPPALVICNSRATAATAGSLFPATPAEVYYYPVALPMVGRAAHHVPVIVQVSRMEAWKGHSLHLDALALLPKELAWECRFIGGAQSAKEEVYSRELLARAGSDRIQFMGQRTDIAGQLAGADIFCQPNTGPEPFGLVFVEALAAGLPVVTTRLGAAPEIIDESCGILTAPGDPQALASALARLLPDGALRRRLGAAGPARARELCDPARQLPLLGAILAKIESER
jgi:glycosyltransferase involved in cell wall biosynthesis